MAKNESKDLFDEDDVILKNNNTGKDLEEGDLFDDEEENKNKQEGNKNENEDDDNEQPPTGNVEIEKPIVSTIPEWARAEGVRPSKEDEREFNRPIIDLPVDRDRLNPNTAWMRA